MRVSVIIPTLNAGAWIVPLLESLRTQSRRPDEVLVVDSDSADGTAALARQHGARVLTLRRECFDHGGTRDWALRQSCGDIVFFLTQDALPADDRYVERLLTPFEDLRVSAASGRQLPRPEARLYVKAVQAYRYPAQSRVWDAADADALGLRAFHLSDACAAYRRSAYEAVGGFVTSLPTNEDMQIASAFLKDGWRLAYCAEATVLHSHSFTFRQEYLRNRQVGRFLARYASRLGSSGELGEGMRMARAVSLQLLRDGHVMECAAFALNCAARLLGSRAGRRDEARRQRGQSRAYEG